MKFEPGMSLEVFPLLDPLDHDQGPPGQDLASRDTMSWKWKFCSIPSLTASASTARASGRGVDRVEEAVAQRQDAAVLQLLGGDLPLSVVSS
jgi:hypothetical protein